MCQVVRITPHYVDRYSNVDLSRSYKDMITGRRISTGLDRFAYQEATWTVQLQVYHVLLLVAGYRFCPVPQHNRLTVAGK